MSARQVYWNLGKNDQSGALEVLGCLGTLRSLPPGLPLGLMGADRHHQHREGMTCMLALGDILTAPITLCLGTLYGWSRPSQCLHVPATEASLMCPLPCPSWATRQLILR